jgi:soluble lytic murein transglycosylase-like protein
MNSAMDVNSILLERISRAQSRYAACAARAGLKTVDFAGVLSLAQSAQAAQAAPGAAVTGVSSTLSAAGGSYTAATGTAYDGIINEAAARYGLDPALIQAVIKIESRFQSDAVSYAGAQGLMQLMPRTAASLGVTDSLDPAQNVDGGSRYLSQQLARFGNVRLALAAYTAGPGTVSSLGITNPDDPAQYQKLSSRVRNYIDKVLEFYGQYSDDSRSGGQG